MVIYCVSDLHMALPEIPECDVLLIAGDIFNVWVFTDPELQKIYLQTAVKTWLDQIPAKTVIFTPGNHDFMFELLPRNEWPDLRWHVLIDEEMTLATDGGPIKVYGTPWTRFNGPLAFNK